VPAPARNTHVREEGRLAAAAVAAAAAASSLVEERGGETGRRQSVQEGETRVGREGGEGHGQRRRMSEVAGPPRGGGARTPGDGDGEDRASGDDGLRGGAASGLLSLARS
jgi:hypothetical protein